MKTGTALHQTLAALLAEGDTVRIRVAGNCMAPVLADGQYVAARNCGHYLPGDILVVASVDGRWLIHRLLGAVPFQRAQRYLTRGDNNAGIDAIPAQSWVLGKVITVDGCLVSVPWSLRVRCGLVGFCWLARLVAVKLHRQFGRMMARPVAGNSKAKC